MRIEIDNIDRNFPLTLETFIFIDDSKYAIITFGYECRYIGANNYVAVWWIIDIKENTISLNEIYTHAKNIRDKHNKVRIYINQNEILEKYFKDLKLKNIECNIEQVLPFAKGILRDERVKVPSKFKDIINNNLKDYTFEKQNILINCLLLGLSKVEFQTLAPEDDIERRKILSELKEDEGIPSKYDSSRIIHC